MFFNYFQAIIVRIMKARKTLSKNDLIEIALDQSKTRFTPTNCLIMERIDSLVERDFLKLDSTNSYTYVAWTEISVLTFCLKDRGCK